MKPRSQWALKSWELLLLLLLPRKHRMMCVCGGKSRVIIQSWNNDTSISVSLEVAFLPALYKPVMLYRHKSQETDRTFHHPKKMLQRVGIFIQDGLRRERTQQAVVDEVWDTTWQEITAFPMSSSSTDVSARFRKPHHHQSILGLSYLS